MIVPNADTIITDAVNDRVELQVGRSPVVTDCIYLQVHETVPRGMSATDVRHVYLNKASAKVLFARLGAFLHDWNIDDD